MQQVLLALGSAAGAWICVGICHKANHANIAAIMGSNLVYWLSCKFRANMDGTRILKEGNIPEIRILPEAGCRTKRKKAVEGFDGHSLAAKEDQVVFIR